MAARLWFTVASPSHLRPRLHLFIRISITITVMPHSSFLRRAIAGFFLCAISFTVHPLAFAGQNQSPSAPPPDKSQFNLFHPTPVTLMRDFSTDRPDKTESPYTVDAGHFQIEMDLVHFTQEDEDGVRVRTLKIAPINFKIGLLNQVDLQIIYDPYVRERVTDRSSGTSMTASGGGDITARLKVNLWGNDGGPTALAIMPFVKIPTHAPGFGPDSVEGGIIVPFALELPAGWGLGIMAEVDFIRNEDDGDYHAEFIQSITFGHDIVGNLAGYMEFFSNISGESGADWVATFDVGLTYALSENIQLDAGCNFGLTDAADDIQPFVGISLRF